MEHHISPPTLRAIEHLTRLLNRDPALVETIGRAGRADGKRPAGDAPEPS